MARRVDVKKGAKDNFFDDVFCAFYWLEMDFVELDAASRFWQPCHLTGALAWS